MAGTFIPDMMKIELLLPRGYVEHLLGIPFSWGAIHTAGGAFVAVLIGIVFQSGQRAIGVYSCSGCAMQVLLYQGRWCLSVNRFVEWLDRAPAHVPERLKPFLRPITPLYNYTQNQVYRIAQERIVRTPWGPTILVDPANYVERRLAQGTFETETIDYFYNIAEGHTGHFADVGANIGFFSILFDLVSEDDSTIDAFEPLEANRNRMAQNLDLNDSSDITICSFALCDHIGTEELWVSDSNLGEASLSERLHSGTPEFATEIELRTLDDVYPATDGTVPDLIKVDIEGGEVQALRGGHELLAEYSPELLIELHPSMIQEFGDSIEGLVSLLSEAGYSSAYHIEANQEVGLDDFNRQPDQSPHLHLK
jgi:FkbM family methyltransferase